MAENGDPEQKTATSRRSVLIAVLGAIGGTVVTFAGHVLVSAYNKWSADNDQKRKKVEELQAEYLGLAEKALRAQIFIEEGTGGTQSDVRDVAGHFQRLVHAINNGNIRIEDVARLYGGSLVDWRRRLNSLANGPSPASGFFNRADRDNFRQLAAAIDVIAGQIPPITANTNAVGKYVLTPNTVEPAPR